MRKTVLCAAAIALLATFPSPPAMAQTPPTLTAPAPAVQPSKRWAAWDKISGNWKNFRGKLRQQWGKLTKNDLEISRGRRDVLIGRIQARYGIDKEKADAQMEAWLKQQK